jgi:hypothetical protein
MENEEEMKEIKEEIKVKEQIAKIEKEIDTIQAIFTKYSSDRWEFLRHTSSFREQEPNEEFYKFGAYSFGQLVSKESKLQDEKMILEERQNKLLDEKNLLLQKSLPGIKPFHFFTINDI